MPDPGTVLQKPIISRRFALAMIVVIGLGLRILAASGGPWLDEIWSWSMFAKGNVLVAHDNNHLLNTLWLWLLCDVHWAFAWRIPAIVCGVASIMVAARLLRRFGRIHSVFGALLIAVSQPMVVYQSEARGYAPMLLCTLLLMELQLRLLDTRERRRLRIALTLVVTAGMLSHLSFAIVYAIVLASAWVLTSSRRVCLLDHAGAIALSAIWWLGFGRHMSIGGGPELPAISVLSETAGSVLGSPAWAVAIAIVPLLVVLSAAILKRRAPALALMLVAMSLVYPLIVLAVSDRLLFLRYFLPGILASTLLIGAATGEMIRQRRYRAIAAGVAIVLVGFHVQKLFPLLRDGRDGHAAALADLCSLRAGPVTVGSDCDFRLQTILSYYEPRGATRVPISEHPEWLIVMRRGEPDHLTLAGTEYTAHASYNAYSLSGIPWRTYKRVDPVMQITAAERTAR